MKMEIAPIPGIRALPAVRAQRAEMQPPAVFDIDPSAKPEDDRDQRNGRKAAGAEENEEDDFAVESEAAANAAPLEEPPPKQVDYFA